MPRLAFLCACLCAFPAIAEPLGCGKPADMFADVAKQYGEVPTALMVREGNGGQVLFLTVNPETKTWTMFAQTGTDGKICAVMGGDSWRDMTAPVKPEAGA